MVRVIEGNLFDTTAELIAHQVNCQKTMGSGVARQVRDRYPDVYKEYLEHDGYLGDVQIYKPKGVNTPFIVNLYAQDKYGYDGKQYTDLSALKKCFYKLNEAVPRGGIYTIAMPYKIGCGRGGADWNEVYKIIEEIFTNVDVELWRLEE